MRILQREGEQGVGGGGIADAHRPTLANGEVAEVVHPAVARWVDEVLEGVAAEIVGAHAA